MRTGNLLRHRWCKAVGLVAVGAVGGGAALAVASVPDSSGQIHACVNVTTQGGVLEPNPSGGTPNITVIDPSAGQHCIADDGTITNQTTLSWNATGPQGPAGVPGTPGMPGRAGAQGATGAGVTNMFTVAPPLLTSNSPSLGTVKLGSGASALSFGFLSDARAGAGKVNTHDINITKYVDKSSAKLYQASTSGKHFPSVTLTMRKAKGSKEYLVITLEEVFITSYQTSATQGKNSVPTESFTLTFSKIKYTYKQQSETGG